MNQPAQKIQAPSRLQRVIRGRLEKPVRVVLYATDGLGKSTFASNAPSPVFVGAEDGTAHLDVVRMPDVTSWRDILDCIDELATVDHDYKTFVLDTADWAEPMCWEFIAAAAKKPDIESLPYGKGYTAALDQWRIMLAKLERLRARNMHVLILAHSVIKTFKNPTGDDFDRFEMKLHQKASGLLREWADCVLFGSYETFTSEVNGRAKGVSTGARILHTQRTAAWDAKNRYDLPELLPLDWQAFVDAVAAKAPASIEALRRRIDKLLEQTSDQALIQQVKAAVAAAGSDATKLAKYTDHLAAKISIQKGDSE